MGLFNDRRKYDDGTIGVPVWFMRQAGRYHDHYQQLKKSSHFMELCKKPNLARDVTMGPIEEFHFDAAILFSDLLFPLEQMGLGLTYAPGPKLEKHLKTLKDVQGLEFIADPATFYAFQREACALLKESLPKGVSLLGFVGAPWTLYTYAVEGGHSGNLIDPKLGLYDGRWEAFCDKLFDNLLEEMNQQVLGGAEAICLFDTAAGECAFNEYTQDILPRIKQITKAFKARHPDTKIIYYSKSTHLHYLEAIEDKNIDVLGIDWRMDLGACLKTLGKDYMIQGNFDPALLHLPWEKLESKLSTWWSEIQTQDLPLERWICGLGHGVLQRTPEQNVFKTVEYIHNNFRY
jgi:uroporphyrinogen decarboxylase